MRSFRLRRRCMLASLPRLHFVELTHSDARLSASSRLAAHVAHLLNARPQDITGQRPLVLEYVTLARSGYTAAKIEQSLLRHIPAHFTDSKFRLCVRTPADAAAVPLTNEVPEMEPVPPSDPTHSGQLHLMVIILNGANHAFRLHSLARYEAEHLSLVRAVRAALRFPGAVSLPVMCVAPPPIAHFPGLPPFLRTTIGGHARRLGAHLQALCDRHTDLEMFALPMLDLVDLAAEILRRYEAGSQPAPFAPLPLTDRRLNSLHLLADARLRSDATAAFSRDGVHLGEFGIEVWATGCATQIYRALCAKTPPAWLRGVPDSALLKVCHVSTHHALTDCVECSTTCVD